MLVNGQWIADWQPVQHSDSQGRFVRQTSSFRDRVGDNGRFPAEPGRYLLYAAYICPWASRALIARRLKGLDNIIDLVIVDPRLSREGWAFTGDMDTDADPALGATHLHALYTHADPGFTGRATVPVLWDRETGTIVNNESADLLRIFDTDFAAYTVGTPMLRPAGLESEIDATNQWLYTDFNNGVYQAGFATTQAAYYEAVTKVFAAMDRLERRLDGRDWLVGDQLTETDIRAFVTLVRFDLAYFGLFKCNLRPLTAYPALTRYLQRLLTIPAFAASVRPDHIKAGYYSIRTLNPSGIVPAGPDTAALGL